MNSVLSDEKSFLPTAVLKTLFDNVNAYICISEINSGEILFINNKMLERCNITPGTPASWETFINSCNSEKKSPHFELFTKNPDKPLEWEEQHLDRYYKNTLSAVKWSGGKTACLFYSTDITEIKKAENSLKKQLNQQKLMSAISQSFTSVEDTPRLITEALKMAGEFMNVNHSFLAEYRADEGCLECIYEWFDEESTPYKGKESKWPISSEMDIYKDLTANGFAAVEDYKLLTHPNFKTVQDYNLRAFLNIPIEISGKFWGVIGFIINKHAYSWSKSDIYLGKLIAGVFSGVIGRTAAEENLLQAKEIAEKASKSKGDFLSCMSHEMRTPMNAIIGMTRIAKKSGDPQKMEYCLDRINSASKHLLGIINDILDISKIEVNKLELSPVEFDFERMLKNIIGVVNFRAEDKKQALIINIDKELPSAFIGDEMRLSQVIVNLVSNAVKFTPENGTIILNAVNQGTENGISTVLFEVIDSGIGISEEQKNKLFAPFVQAESGIARKYGGTGLGLTISKGIVELMGGKIWIESTLGQGSKFSFTVKMQAGKGLPRLKISDAAGKNPRVLAITALPAVRDYLSRALPELNLSCDIAENEASAIEIIANNNSAPHTILLIDWTESEKNEFGLIKRMKRLTDNSNVILMISETDWSNIEKNAVEAGVSSFVFKPLFQSAIVTAINEAAGAAAGVKAVEEENHTYNFEDYAILIAEDIEINREIIAAVLEETKISIDFAHDGIEAVTMFKNNPEKYGLVLMDIHMPEMDGYEATKSIRAGEQNRRTPIIAMTANVFREDIDKCLSAGMDDHLGKPLDTKQLLSKLEGYLEIGL